MAELPEPFYATGPAPEGKVMVGGKPPELVASDLAAGVARIGGFWRHPNYFEAYLYSATLLIEQGQIKGTLDEIGLPAFYLQRHAVELLLKDLLHWLIYIADLRTQLHVSTYEPPQGAVKAQATSHNLKKLLEFIVQVSTEMALPAPPVELGILIADMSQFELTETWARYSSSYVRQKSEVATTILHVKHVEEVIEIPIVAFQQRLVAVAKLAISREPGGESYEDMLYDEWSPLDSALSHIRSDD